MILFVHILSLLIIFILTILVYKKQIKYKKVCDDLAGSLSKNVEFLTVFSKHQEILQLKSTIKLYSKFQIILKISNCNYVTFFKYDYSQRYIILHFILSVDEKGCIIQDGLLDDLPVTDSLLTLNLIKTDNNDLYELNLNNIKEKNIHNVIIKSEINKVYYQNIYKDKSNPLGFISLSYKDKNFTLLDDDKNEILRIIEKMKTYL